MFSLKKNNIKRKNTIQIYHYICYMHDVAYYLYNEYSIYLIHKQLLMFEHSHYLLSNIIEASLV